MFNMYRFLFIISIFKREIEHKTIISVETGLTAQTKYVIIQKSLRLIKQQGYIFKLTSGS